MLIMLRVILGSFNEHTSLHLSFQNGKFLILCHKLMTGLLVAMVPISHCQINIVFVGIDKLRSNVL
jgi:hypothetical protein